MIGHSGSNYQGNTGLGWKTADHLDGVDGHHIDTDMVLDFNSILHNKYLLAINIIVFVPNIKFLMPLSMKIINYFGCAMQVTSYSSTDSGKNFNVEN